MTPGARQTWRAVAATLGACLLVVLVGWAALIGPSPVLTGQGPTMSTTTSTPTETPPVEEELDREDVAQRDYGAGTSIIANLIGGAIQVFFLVALVFVAWWLARRALRSWRLRRRFDAPPDLELEPLEDGHPERVRRTMAADAEEQLRLLIEGRPRNAIVACWHRFEVQALEAGLAPHAWETSSEFALRFLDRADVDPHAVSRLLGLYREARFSEHDLGEDDRAAAVAALRQVQSHVVRR